MSLINLIPSLFKNNYLVRSYMDNENNIWVCCKDICDVLDIKDNSNILRTLDEDEKIMRELQDLIDRHHQMRFISESGVYKLLFRSRKEIAKEFVRWITKEVIPTIRKTGSYSLKPNPVKEQLECQMMIYEMHSKLGLDERDELFYKDRFRDFNLKLLTNTSDVITPERVSYPLSDFLRDNNMKYDKNKLKAFGRFVSKRYFELNNIKPIQRQQHVDGTTRLVNNYTSDDKDFLMKCFNVYFVSTN